MKKLIYWVQWLLEGTGLDLNGFFVGFVDSFPNFVGVLACCIKFLNTFSKLLSSSQTHFEVDILGSNEGTVKIWVQSKQREAGHTPSGKLTCLIN